MRSHISPVSAAPLWSRGIGAVFLIVVLLSLSSQSTAINARLERPGFIFELRDFLGYVMPKKDGQVPLESSGVDIGPSIIFETIPGDATQLMNFRSQDVAMDLMVSSTTELVNGVKRWRWEILSQLLENPASFNDIFLQVYEIFESDTTATLYGGSAPISVNGDTLYYSQVIDLSHWNASVFCTGFRIVTWADLYTNAPARDMVTESSSVDRRTTLGAPEFNFTLISFPFVDVDGVKTSAPLADHLTDAAWLTYASIQNVPLPTNRVVQHFYLKISAATDSRIAAPVKLPAEGYKQSAIAVGVVFGLMSLVVIAGVATYFFCLKQWMPVWHVLSVPGRYVSGRLKLWTRPPAPTFHEEDTEMEEEDDPLNAERVDAEQILKLTSAAVGSAATGKHSRQGSSTDNVLARLRKAMGRRLSNFVGWDGPPSPGSSTPADRSPSPSKKDKKGKKSNAHTASSSSGHNDIPHIITPEMIPNMVELEGSSGSNVNLNVHMYAARNGDGESAVGLLTDRDESPSPIRPPAAHQDPSDAGIDSTEDLDSSHDASARSSAPLRGGREFPDSSEEPPRHRKPGGLRHFKITSSQTSSTTDVLASLTPSATNTAPLLSPPDADNPSAAPSSPRDDDSSSSE